MKCLTIIILLITSGYSYGQTVRNRGIRLAILVPNTIIIDSKLLEYAQAIESEHIKDYYRKVTEMEVQLESWKSEDSISNFPLTRRAMEKRLELAKTLEPEVKQYKYFYKIVDYSLYHFRLKCGEFNSDSVLVIGTKTRSKKTIKEIAEKFNLDYLVSYTQIIAIAKDKEYEMKLTETLYSKSQKVLFKEEFITTSKCPDDKLKCLTPFCCMLTNITKLSTTKICETLESLRKK
jgi:hypothetical protein